MPFIIETMPLCKLIDLTHSDRGRKVLQRELRKMEAFTASLKLALSDDPLPDLLEDRVRPADENAGQT